MSKGVTVAGFRRKAVWEFCKESDEVCVIVCERVENIVESCDWTQCKSGLGVELFVNIVYIVPGVNKFAPPERPVKIDNGTSPTGNQNGIMEKGELYIRYTQYPKYAIKKDTAAPETYEWKKGGFGGK